MATKKTLAGMAAHPGYDSFYVIYFAGIHLLGAYGLYYAWQFADSAIIQAAIVYFFVCCLLYTSPSPRDA